MTAFSESLREEVVDSDVRVTSIEPGVVDTELAEHIPDEDRRHRARSGNAVSQPSHVDVNELLIRPTRQEL